MDWALSLFVDHVGAALAGLVVGVAVGLCVRAVGG